MLSQGRAYDLWRITPVNVYGGWQLMRTRWVRDPFDGWDMERETIPGQMTVYATKAQANNG